MTDKAKSRVKELLSYCGQVEITIADDNDQFIEEKKFTEYEEAVSEIQFQESVGNQVFL